MRRNTWIVSVLVATLLGLVAGAVGPDLAQRDTTAELSHEVQRWVRGTSYTETDRDPPFTCWGDSLTYGFGTTPWHDFPEILQRLHHRPTRNEGIAHETSAQVRDRMLARSRPEGAEHVILWAGRNNADQPDQVKRDIATMVASLNPGSAFLVLGILNGNYPPEWKGSPIYADITALNRDLQATYGKRFIPVREQLLARANPRFTQDMIDVDHDVPPRSLRYDNLHLNDQGQAIVAQAIADAFVVNGW